MLINRAMRYRDIRWAAAWVAGTAALWTWNLVFLNRPALARVSAGFFNTFAIALLVAAFTLGLGWAAAIGLHSLDIRGRKTGYLLSLFAFNLVRSVPQIVGILFGYVGVAWLREHGLPGPLVFPLLALCISMFIFPELVDLMRDRIGHYRASDFYNAMRVCGITERRIVNFHILWRNSRVHIFNKLISVFGMAVFLQCSVDFIISVGLTLDVSSVSLPPTLGSVLAKIDSKQDILAIGYTVTHPAYLPKLVFRHLQGLTAAFLIVYTLLCAHRISTGFARRHRL